MGIHGVELVHKKVTKLKTETGQYLEGADDSGSEDKYYVEDQAYQEKPNREILFMLENGHQMSRVRPLGEERGCGAREALFGVSSLEGRPGEQLPLGDHR